MKYRTGFVSNSSSSSFIVGIGVITDSKKYNEWIKMLPNKDDILTRHSIEEEKKRTWSTLNISNKYISTTAPINSEPEVMFSIEDYNNLNREDRDDDIVVLCISNGEGDSAFYTDEDDYYCDYDISLNFFDKNQQKIYNEFGKENGIELADLMYGAGRNG